MTDLDPHRFFAGPERCRHCTATFSTADKRERHVRHAHPWRRHDRTVLMMLAMMGMMALMVWMMQPGPPPPLAERLGLADDPLLGDPDASQVLVVFESPGCTDCAQFHLRTLPEVQAAIDAGRLAIIFVAAEGDSPMDRAAGIAQECSHRHGGPPGYRLFSQALFQNQSRLDEHTVHTLLEDYAVWQGIPEADVMRCYYAEEALSAVEDDWRVARDTGAPPGSMYWLQDRLVPADIDAVRRA